jgi:hypothetical protein
VVMVGASKASAISEVEWRGRVGLMEGKSRWHCGDSFSCGRGGQRPSVQWWWRQPKAAAASTGVEDSERELGRVGRLGHRLRCDLRKELD